MKENKMKQKNYNIQVNYEQIISLIRQLKYEDKVNILKELKESTFKKRFKKLLDSLKTNELPLNEITKEVEAVRAKRYEKGK
jgi:ribosomal protein L29